MRITVEGSHGLYCVKCEAETGSPASWLCEIEGMPVWIANGERLRFEHASAALTKAAELMDRLEKMSQSSTRLAIKTENVFTKMVFKKGDRLRVTETHSHEYLDDNGIEQKVEVPEGTVITAAEIVDNKDEFTVCFVYQGHELLSPSDCFVRYEP